jgi:transketolase N-terminal domain/subunit
VMNIDPGEPRWERRDRFINSKGHATAAYCATLANRGYSERVYQPGQIWPSQRNGRERDSERTF